MEREACRACDGRGSRSKPDPENVMKVVVSQCGPCRGSGKKQGPPKNPGRRGFFRAGRVEMDADEANLEQAADRFLAQRGFGRNG